MQTKQQNIRVEIREGSLAYKALLELKKHQKFSDSNLTHIVNVAITSMLQKTNQQSDGEYHHDTAKHLVTSS